MDTELCVVGRNIFSQTRWDDQITALLPSQTALALEQWIGGYFMAEIIRRILLEATEKTMLFNGHTPENLRQFRTIPLELFAALEG